MSYKFLEWDSLPFKKNTGKEKLRCPNCNEKRSDKRDKSLSINHNDGFGKCFYCEALTFQDSNNFTDKKYDTPKPDWVNFTELSDGLVKWAWEQRRIRQQTLNHFNITEESIFQPKKGKEANSITFNYFEGDKIVNKKYRTADKCFTQFTNGKPIFYNINATINAEEVWIVEGEFDVLALYEVGIKNAISVPNGANDNPTFWENCDKYLKNINRFIIATDNDAKGIELRDNIAKRIGRYKCTYIEFQNKDANGDLIAGVLEKSIANLKKFPIGGTHTVSDLFDKILNLYDNGLPETLKPKNKCFGNLSNIFSTMRGHLVTVTGIPSHGKSSFLDWYVLNLVNDYTLKASIFSPEHGALEMHQTNFSRLAIGKSFFGDNRMTKNDLVRYRDWAENRLFMTSVENDNFPTWNWIFEKFKEQVYTYGIDIFVIDAFNKLDFDNNAPQIQNITKALSRLTMFAQMHNVLVFLVAHPTKMQRDEQDRYKEPTLYDVAGSADFRNQTHDGFVIYRDFGSSTEQGYSRFRNLKTKFPFQGEIQAFEDFYYENETGRFYATNSMPYDGDMTKPKEPQNNLELKTQYDDREFRILDEEDVPF